MGETNTNTGRVGSTATITIDTKSEMIGGPYQVVWSKTPITKDSTDFIVISQGKEPTDATKVTITFTVPEATYGRNYVEFQRTFRPDNPYDFMFTVLPDLQASPSPAAPESQVTIKGTGFPADQAINVTFDGQDTGLNVTTNELGSFAAPFTIPNSPAGQHEFNGSFGAGTTEYAAGSVTVRPMITLNPENPDIGQEITVAGNGFAAANTVSLKFDDVDVTSSPSTDANGSFSCNFKVPSTTISKHTVVATDRAGNTTRFGVALDSTPPPVPSTISSSVQGGGLAGPQLVTFTWTDVSDPNGISYTLEIADNLYFFPLAAGMRKTNLTNTDLTLSLPPGTYYWRVKAVDGASNESGWALAPYPVKVGVFSPWYLIIGGLIFLIVFILVVRAFIHRLRQYYPTSGKIGRLEHMTK